MMQKTSHTIQERILALIQAGSLGPGDRLPSERAMAAEFRVSRNTVREAIRILVEQEVIDCRVGSGSYITEQASDIMAAALRRKHEKQRLRLAEVLEMRKLLEPSIARLAAVKMTPVILTELADAVARQREAFDAGENPAPFDEAFHAILVSAAGNSILSTVYDTLREFLAESRSRDLQTRDRARRSIRSHTRIIEALKQGDPASVEALMALHVEEIEKVLVRSGTAAADPTSEEMADTCPKTGGNTVSENMIRK